MNRQQLINQTFYNVGLSKYEDFLYTYDELMDLLIIVEYTHKEKYLDYENFKIPEYFDCLACNIPFMEKIINLNLNNIKFVLYPFDFEKLTNIKTIIYNKLITGYVLNRFYEISNRTSFFDKKLNSISLINQSNIEFLKYSVGNKHFKTFQKFNEKINKIKLEDIENKKPEKSYLSKTILNYSPFINIIGYYDEFDMFSVMLYKYKNKFYVVNYYN